jgi:hypothetical protein
MTSASREQNDAGSMAAHLANGSQSVRRQATRQEVIGLK